MNSPSPEIEKFLSANTTRENSESKNEETASFLGEEKSKGGLTVTFAVLFIVGEMAGSGILALPRYLQQTFKRNFSSDFSKVLLLCFIWRKNL